MVECPLVGCTHNAKDRDAKGTCQLENIELKWRFAADMGKGNIVCMECLYLELVPDAKG